MIWLSIICFLIAGAVGAHMLRLVLNDLLVPRLFPTLHGIFVILAVIFLLVYSVNKSNYGFIFVLLAFAIGGVGSYLFAHDLNGKPIPKKIAIFHGIGAILGMIALIIFALA